MSELKAILFDLDGTLIDSERFHYECWAEILTEFSIPMGYEEWAKNYAGFPLPLNCERIKEKYNLEISLADLMAWRERLSVEGFSTKDINLMPFALDVIQFYKSIGLKLAIVTASPRLDVKLIFERNGLSDYFDLMVTRTDVTISKPHPESYNFCINKLAIEKGECIVFEDTISGLTAAKAAGLTCYVIQHDTSQHEKLSTADNIFLDLKEAKEFITANFVIK